MFATMMTQDRNNSQRRKKSIELTAQEKRRLNKYANSFRYKEDCAEKLGLTSQTITRILGMGVCSQDTYEKLIKEGVIKQANA